MIVFELPQAYNCLTMTDHHLGSILEDIDDKLAMLIEGQSVQATSLQLKAVDERLQSAESDIKVIRKVVTAESTDSREQTRRLNSHEIRITSLEDEYKLKYA